MKNKQKETIRSLQKGTEGILCKVKAVFPLQLFPDSITVDSNKIDIIYREFFWTKYIFTILHEDLRTIKVSTVPFFATVYFEVKGYEDNPRPVRFLWSEDAVRLREVIIGLNKAIKKKVEVEELPNGKAVKYV